MTSTSFVLAVVLITSPELPKEVRVDAALMKATKSVAITMELIDQRESTYLLKRQEDFTPDLKTIRRRYKDFGDGPPLCDANRFPERKLCSELLFQNRKYKQFLEDRVALGPSLAGEYVDEAMNECDRLYHIWDTVRDTQCDYYYISVRRTALKKLRDQIGYANYYAGFLPPHVPVWRFRRID